MELQAAWLCSSWLSDWKIMLSKAVAPTDISYNYYFPQTACLSLDLLRSRPWEQHGMLWSYSESTCYTSKEMYKIKGIIQPTNTVGTWSLIPQAAFGKLQNLCLKISPPMDKGAEVVAYQLPRAFSWRFLVRRVNSLTLSICHVVLRLSIILRQKHLDSQVWLLSLKRQQRTLRQKI